jgi:hypothetical protein
MPTGFPVSWDLSQLGLSEGFLEELRAAEILEDHGYRTCIVGDVASVVYGSDVVVSDVHIAVADDEVQCCLETLVESGFLEVPQTKFQYKESTPMKDSSSGWPGHKLRRRQPNGNAVGILLIPATLWHLDLDKSYLSNTLLFPQSKCRFPHIEPYLDGNKKCLVMTCG